MRIIRLPPYERGEKDAKQAKAWVLIAQALLSDQAGDAKSSRDLLRALDAWEAVQRIEQADTPTETRYLQFEGAEIVVEDGVFDRIRAAWERFSGRLTGQQVRDKIFVDVLLGVITDEPEHPAARLVEKLTFEEWQKREKGNA